MVSFASAKFQSLETVFFRSPRIRLAAAAAALAGSEGLFAAQRALTAAWRRLARHSLRARPEPMR